MSTGPIQFFILRDGPIVRAYTRDALAAKGINVDGLPANIALVFQSEELGEELKQILDRPDAQILRLPPVTLSAFVEYLGDGQCTLWTQVNGELASSPFSLN